MNKIAKYIINYIDVKKIIQIMNKKKVKKYIIKFLFIIYLFFMLAYLKKIKLEEPFEKKIRTIITKDKKNSLNYFACFVGIARLENLYARELIEHYISIGFDKFYIGDHNSLNYEPLSDVLKDYIDKGILDIIDLRDQEVHQIDFNNYIFNAKKNVCKWLSFFDFDEFLEFNDKNMNIKTYLSKEEFNKCDTILIHWLSFFDNDLVHYDKRPVKERFTKPNYNNFENNYHKSIVRGKNYSSENLFHNVHQPNISLVKFCDAEGNIENFRDGYLGIPKFKYCHLNHYSMKTIEEFLRKFKIGNFQYKYDYDYRIKFFFKYDKITNEKLDIIEKKLNYNCSELRKYLNSYYPK